MEHKMAGMTLEQARELGQDHGFDMAQSAIMEGIDRSKVQETVWDAMENFRQFTPFEIYASAMNEADDPDAVWEVYEAGIDDGIQAALTE